MAKEIKYKIEQKNKYLDKLGLKPHQYGINFIDKKEFKKNTERVKKWKKQKKEYGFDSRETWTLNTIYAQWLYSHLKMYLQEADGIVNLKYHKIEYKNKEYTQKKLIKKAIKLLEEYIIEEKNNNLDADINKVQKANEIFTILLPYMWW